MLDPNRALSLGVPTKVADAITATGTGQSRAFSIINSMAGKSEVVCTCDGTFTVLDGNLESSANGGDAVPVWIVVTVFNFIGSPVFVFDATPGIIYRFNVSHITQSVAPNIIATHR